MSKKRVDDATEVHLHSDQFSTIFATFAASTKDMDGISLGVDHFGTLIENFDTKNLPCDKYTTASETQDSYYDDITIAITNTYVAFMHSQENSIHIQYDRHLDAKLDKLMELKSTAHLPLI